MEDTNEPIPWGEGRGWAELTYQCQRVGNLGNENARGLDTLVLAEFVAAILFETLLGLVVAQAVLGVGRKLLLNLLEGQSVRGGTHGLVGLARDMLGDGLIFLFTHCVAFLGGGTCLSSVAVYS